MNEKLLDSLFARRKEAVTRLAICLFLSAILAVASRIPILFVSLPATWISGGLSIAFIWVIGPPVLLVLQAYALHGITEAEQLRQLLNSQARIPDGSTLSVAQQLGDELAPIWRRNSPPVIHLALAATMLAPTIAGCILFSSYLDLVRPLDDQPRYSSRSLQIIDAMTGIGGWKGFLPIAPSLQSNLRKFEINAEKAEDKIKYKSLREEIPWVLFPIQSWAYLCLLAISLDGAVVGGACMTGESRFGKSILIRGWQRFLSRSHRIS